MNLLESDLTSVEKSKLLEICEQAPGETYMEIGVFNAGTFNEVVTNYDFHNYIAVDLWEDFVPDSLNTHVDNNPTLDDVREAVCKKSGVKFIKCDSRELLAHHLFSFEGVIFIDGNHSYNGTMIDFLNSLMLLKYGYILIHNASNDMYPDVNYVANDGGPYKVVEFGKKLRDLEYLGTFDRLAIFRK